MCMVYTDDPVADFHRHDTEQQAKLDKMPRCADCKQPITDEFAYYRYGEWICEQCIDSYRQPVPEE
jgi:formylmethanofuran dehydrogenase subunit E